MNCPSCGADVRPGQRFCAECGTRLARACTACGEELPAKARFCPSCGTPAADVAPGEAAQAVRAIPPAEADDAGVGRSGGQAAAPVAERRLVSVLFCDLVGFTGASEGRDAEETRELLTAYYDLASERVERYGGTIEKFIGDAVMAVWGVPTAREDDAERAVRAALDLVAAVARLGAEGATGRGGATAPGLAARAAVLTGEAAVTVGALGQGMVAGDLVNTASRLQAAAAPGVVLVGEATRAVTERAIAYEAAGEQQLKGKSLPVPAWRAVRAVALVGGRHASDELEPPFVGRDMELRFITELYHSAAHERRLRLVSVTGQAGIGKSRLARELEKYLDGIAETVHWHRGRCPSYGQGVTFWAIGEMVRRRAGIAEGDDPATTTQRLRDMLAEFVPDPVERERIDPALRALLGLDTHGWSVSETGELYVAWRTLFERIAEQGPVVLVFEDLQWADDGLVGFIQHLLEWSRSQPILVVTLARPEFLDTHPTWGAGLRSFASLHLEPLPVASVIEMLEGVIPGIPASAARAIAARAEGVPLYAVETIRMLLAQGVLERDGPVLRLRGDIGAVAIPDSLRGLVAARLDTLPPTERALLQDAAVLGQSFGIETLAAVTGSAPEAIEPLLHELVRRELLRLERDPRSPERGQYLWVQAVIREVAYATLSRRDRRARHLAAARYFDTLGDEEVAGILADHYLEAWRASSDGAEADALKGQARVALRAAIDRAERLRNWRQATALVGRALEVSSDADERPALLERMGDLLVRAGDWQGGEARYREALSALPSGSDPDVRARLMARVAQQIVSELRIGEAQAYLESAVADLGPELAGPGRVVLEGQLGRVYALSDDPVRSMPVLQRTIEAAERIGPTDALVDAIVSLASAGTWLGQAAHLAMLFGSVELARRAGLVHTEIRALNNLSVWAEEADPPRSRETREQLIELCDRVGFDPINWLVEMPLGVAVRDGLDAAERLEAELLERVTAGSLDEDNLRQMQLVLRSLRGDGPGFDAFRAAAEAAVERSPEAEAFRREFIAVGLLVLGRTDEAAALIADVHGRWTTGSRVILGLLRHDDDATTAAAGELTRSLTWEGPFARGLKGIASSGVRLMAGGSAADISGYLEAMGELRASLRPGYWALACTALIGLVGLERAEVQAAAAEVRAEMERIGAHGCVALMDRAIGAAVGAVPPAGAPGRSKALDRSAVR